jgi:hypothetical protein
MLLGAWDAYYVHDWYVLRKGTSYSIDGTEFTNTKGGENSTDASTLNGAAASVHDTGVAISSVRCVQLVTVADPVDIGVVFDEIQKS